MRWLRPFRDRAAPAVSFPALLGMAAFTLGPIACQRSDDAGATAVGPSAQPSTITILSGGNERSIVPAWNQMPSFLLFTPLLTNNNAGGGLVGNLAKSFEVSADGRTWTYHLPGNVRWHDGEPFTAHDVAFTYELYSHPDVLRLAPGSVVVSVHDDSTVTIKYADPRRRWYANYWSRFLPRHLLAHLEPQELFSNWDHFWPPVGYGPFRYARHVPETMVELEANPEWIHGRPAIDRVRIRFGGNPTVEFAAGNIDVAHGLNPTEALRIAERPGIEHCIEPLWFSSVIYWNHRHPALSDIRVRRALAHSIDRYELAAVRGFPPDVAMPDVLLTERQRSAFRLDMRSEGWTWPEETPRPIPYDLEAAARLLSEAGWVDEDGDGLRERSGLTLGFELLTSPIGETEAVLLQEQFRRVGARVEIRMLSTSAGRPLFEAGEFEAVLGGVRGSSLTPNANWTIARGLAGNPPGSPDRPVGYFNPRFDSLAAVKPGFDEDLTDEIQREMQAILREDAVVAFLLPELRVTVFRDWIRGLKESCSSWQVHKWWVEDEDQ